LNLNNDEIVKLIEGFEKESRALKDEALRLSWFMRVGITYDDAMMLSSLERELINNIIKENMEITKKSGLNFF
jgi:hypothetical protein